MEQSIENVFTQLLHDQVYFWFGLRLWLVPLRIFSAMNTRVFNFIILKLSIKLLLLGAFISCFNVDGAWYTVARNSSSQKHLSYP